MVTSFDYSSAFDTIGGDVLLSKLKKLDAAEKTIDFFTSYFSGGRQCVTWNGKRSAFVPVSSCCRQGSILGPLLFLLAASDVVDTLALPVVYADDTTGAATDERKAQEEINALEAASASLGLTLNGGKTQAIVLGSKTSDVVLHVDGASVYPGTTLDILGFCVDFKLGTDVYTSKLLKDLRKNLGVLRMLKHRVSKFELRDFAHGIMIGKLATYLANCFVVRLTPEEPICGRAAALQVVVNDLARLLANRRRSDHVEISELLSLAKVPSVNQLVARDAVSMMWTALVAGKGPLVSVLSSLRPASSTRAATCGKLNTPAGSNAIVVSGCKLWNVYHADLVTIKSKNSLKKFVTTKIWGDIPI